MRHLVAKTGGRYTYIEDFVALQDHSIALTSLFDGCNNFILSGCRTSGSNQNLTIAEGYVYINGKIRKFEGATVDLTNPFYIVESERSESVSYAQNATQQGCIYYECFGTTTLPTDKQYIKITSAYIPRLKDEFFGKYAMILDSSFSQQIVNKNLQLNGELNTKQKIVADGNLVIRDYDNSAMLTASQESGNIKLTYNNGVSDLSSISFGSDGTIRFTTANNEQVVITPTNTAVDKIRFNSALSSKLSIIGDEIENYQDSTDEAGINLNRSGYNYSASKPRNFNVFDGKGNLLFKTDGATKRSIFYGGVNEESNEEYGIILKSISHTYREPSFRKSICFKDKDGVIVGHVGFSSASNNNLIIKNEFGEVEIQGTAFNVAGNIKEAGETLSDKYATKSALNNGLADKVSKVAGMGLSEQNFTSSDKAKLDRITTGNIGSGDSGLVSGNEVSQALEQKLSKNSNLSDLTNPTEARSNLQVYSKSDSDSKYLQISKKLTDLPTLSDSEKSVIRNLIDAAKVGDSPVDSGVRKIVQDEIKDLELDSKYVGKAEFAVKQGSSNGLSAYQVGKVVTVSGTVTAPNGTGPWITIPANVDPPKLNLYGSIGRSFGKYDYIRGLSWSCAAGQKTIQVTEQVWQADSVNFCITYLAE